MKKPFVKAVSERLNNYGDIFNKEKSVKKYNKKLAKAMSSLKKTVANKKNPSALFVMVNGGELLAQAPSGRFGWLFTDTGFTSVNKELEANTHGTPISFEYLSEKNPKYLFVLDRGATVGKKASAKSVLENDVVKETEAVKNNHVLQVNGKDWYINAGGINASLRMIKEIQTFMDK
ncbi:ABC transporter substrate-binding protein [Streptococcus didelphis]|nr:ABC transporter substrate-binding protein [Streptococcus didelphis]